MASTYVDNGGEDVDQEDGEEVILGRHRVVVSWNPSPSEDEHQGHR